MSHYYMEFDGRGLNAYFTSSFFKNAYFILSYEILFLCKGLEQNCDCGQFDVLYITQNYAILVSALLSIRVLC